jgi:hypothetical protein
MSLIGTCALPGEATERSGGNLEVRGFSNGPPRLRGNSFVSEIPLVAENGPAFLAGGPHV